MRCEKSQLTRLLKFLREIFSKRFYFLGKEMAPQLALLPAASLISRPVGTERDHRSGMRPRGLKRSTRSRMIPMVINRICCALS